MRTAIAKSRTSSGTVAIKVVTGAVAHFTTMAATDTIVIRKGSSTGTIIATLQPPANNQTVAVQFTFGVKTFDENEADVAYIHFTGSAAGDCTVLGE